MAKKVTVTGRFLDHEGQPARGVVEFVPSNFVRDVPADGLLLPARVVAKLGTSTSAGGRISVELTATDGADVNPSGWVWTVREQFDNGPSRGVYSISLSSDLDTVDLLDLAPVDAPEPVDLGLIATTYSYNLDGTVASETSGGVVTSYTYTSDGSVHTISRGGRTLTYTYNADGSVAGVA